MKIPTPNGDITAAWDRPASLKPKATFVLAHGAGGTLDTPQLKSIAALLAEFGFATLRFNFVYAELGRKAPDRMPQALACFSAVAAAARTQSDGPLILGGRSFGGRVASHLVADEAFACEGLAFLAYPLHPPGKPERIRDEHLPRVNIPMLFISGSRDPFATRDLLHPTVQRLDTATLVEIEGGDHSFRIAGRKPDSVNEELAANLANFAEHQIGRNRH